MKKLLVAVLIIAMLFSLSSVAFANSKVISPENDNTEVPPDDPGEPSPQTGESINVIWVIVAAFAFLAIAFFCVKKLILVK